MLNLNANSLKVLLAFTNKRRNRLKILYFQGTATWVAAIHLEKGSFSWPTPIEPGQRRIKLHAKALQRKRPIGPL